MSGSINPMGAIISKVKNTGKLKNENIKSIIQDGYEKVKKENSKKLHQALRDGELPEDIPRALHRLSELKKEDFYVIEKNEKTGVIEQKQKSVINEIRIMLYLEMLYKGLESEEYITDKQAKNLRKYIMDSKKQLAKDIKEYKQIKQNKKVGIDNMKIKIRVTKLNEEINMFLCNTDEALDDDFDTVEDNEEYDIYIAARKQEVIRLHSDGGRYTYKVIEDPIQQVVYCMSISTDKDFEIIAFNTMQEAIFSIMEDINSNSYINLDTVKRSYTLVEEGGECVEIQFETRDSLSKKICNLLS